MDVQVTDMRNLIEILRYLRGNPGIMTVRPTTLNLEALKRSPVGSVLTNGDSEWAGDADRFSDHSVEHKRIDDRTRQWRSQVGCCTLWSL